MPCTPSPLASHQAAIGRPLISSPTAFIRVHLRFHSPPILPPALNIARWRTCFDGLKPQIKAKAAQILGVSQSRVSDLVRGKWEKFSLEMLITLATRAGIRVQIKTAA